jgi:hypothetical protein
MKIAQSLPGERNVLNGQFERGLDDLAPASVPMDTVPWGPILAVALVVVLVIAVGLVVLNHKRRKNGRFRLGEEAHVVYRIRLPKFRSDEEAKAQDSVQQFRERVAVMESIFSAIGGLSPDKGFSKWLSGQSDVFSFEIVAHQKLVTFYAAVPLKFAEFFEQQVHAQYPDAFFEPATDYNIFTPTGVVVGGYLKLKRENFLPIRTFKDLDSDPLNAITNALSKVAEGDGLAVQVLVRPAHSSWRAKGVKVVQGMQKGMTLKEATQGVSSGWLETKEDREKRANKMRERRLTAAETKMLEGIENKLSKAGLEVVVRVVAASASADLAKGYLANTINAFSQFNVYEYGNAFDKSIPRSSNEVVSGFVHRTFSEGQKMILNTEELTSVFHLPLHSTDTPNINWLLARIAPPPPVLPTAGLLLGYSEYRGRQQQIYMTDSDRRRHTYIIGKTGSGKSEFIKNLVAQDIAAGKGVCVIDPHGDLADGCLELIPEDRIDDVIYFSPADIERPFGLNMMEYDQAFPEQKTMVVNEMLEIFNQLYDLKATGGPMFEQYMRNAMMLVMEDPDTGSTLLEISKVLSDPDFRKMKLSKCTNRVVVDFWTKEAEKAGGEASLANMVPYITSKLTTFISNDIMRPIVAQQKSALDFRKIMDEGKILLVNLSKGKLGEINAALIGMIVVGKLQVAAFARADQAEENRRDFYLYIDEFQNFITPSIATILSEARKYKLSLTMAHQYMGQLVKSNDTRIKDAVLGNVGSMFVARIGPEDVETFGRVFEPTFSGYDLQNTDMYTWNVKMIINNAQGKPFTMKAHPPVKGSRRVAEALKAISRLEYGRDREEVEKEIFKRSGMAALPRPTF